MTEHWLICEAPICADERAYKDQPGWKHEVLWYPGETVCGRRPFTKWQKRQSRINRWHAKEEFKHGDKFYFTEKMLVQGVSLKKGRRGGNPDAKTWDRSRPKMPSLTKQIGSTALVSKDN